MEHVITLFEQQSIPYEYLGVKPDDPLLGRLEKIIQSSGNELLTLERKALRANQYVGVIAAGEYSIQILPKIDCDPEANHEATPGSISYERAATSAAQNFLHLLTHAYQIKLHNQTLASISVQRGSWLELLTRLFAIELMTQLQLGFHQDYVQKDDLYPYIRGRWNIIRQFSSHPNLMGGLDVTFDEYLPDTNLNRIFRYVVNVLQQITRDQNNRQLLSELESWLQSVHLTYLINKSDLDKIDFNRLNDRFFPAFELASLLIKGLSVKLMSGGQRAYAFVFNMDDLFQKLVGNILKSYIHRIASEDVLDLTVELADEGNKKHLATLQTPRFEKLFLLKPDIIMKASGIPKMIIDTKNKALPCVDTYRKVSESDVYQMISYASQYNCPIVLLLYPHTLGGEFYPPGLIKINNTPINIFYASLNLHQSLEKINTLIQDLRIIFSSINQQVLSQQEALYG